MSAKASAQRPGDLICPGNRCYRKDECGVQLGLMESAAASAPGESCFHGVDDCGVKPRANQS
jgi:hypothetical protein